MKYRGCIQSDDQACFGMYRYSITFSSESLDEGALRDILEDKFRVFDCSVARSKLGSTTIPHNELKNVDALALTPKQSFLTKQAKKILSFFEGGELVTPKMIKEAMPEFDSAAVQKLLARLSQDGSVRRVDHGLYLRSDFPSPTAEELKKLRRRKSVRKKNKRQESLVDFLSTPKTAPTIRSYLKVTRQRVDQILKSLLDRGDIFRAKVKGHSYIYCSRKDILDAEVERIKSDLSHHSKRLLSAFKGEGPFVISDVAALIGISSTAAFEAASELSDFGLVEVLKLGRSNIAIPTNRGMANENYGISELTAQSADLFELFGPYRGDIIEVLYYLKQATSREISLALRGVNPGKDQDLQTGQRMQIVKGDGLVETLRDSSERHPSYRLSDFGKRVWSLISKFREPLSEQEVLQHVRTGMEDLHVRTGKRAAWRPSERALSMMRAIELMGPLPLRQITELMDLPFENPRSADLAMKSLAERGLVARDGDGHVGSPYKWHLTRDGQNALEQLDL